MPISLSKSDAAKRFSFSINFPSADFNLLSLSGTPKRKKVRSFSGRHGWSKNGTNKSGSISSGLFFPMEKIFERDICFTALGSSKLSYLLQRIPPSPQTQSRWKQGLSNAAVIQQTTCLGSMTYTHKNCQEVIFTDFRKCTAYVTIFFNRTNDIAIQTSKIAWQCCIMTVLQKPTSLFFSEADSKDIGMSQQTTGIKTVLWHGS